MFLKPYQLLSRNLASTFNEASGETQLNTSSGGIARKTKKTPNNSKRTLEKPRAA